jgi:hypothetical protein
MYSPEAYEPELIFVGESSSSQRLLLRAGEIAPQAEFANQTTTRPYARSSEETDKGVSFGPAFQRCRCHNPIRAVGQRNSLREIPCGGQPRPSMNRQLSSHYLVIAIVAAAIAANLAPGTGVAQSASIASDKRPRPGDPVSGWAASRAREPGLPK